MKKIKEIITVDHRISLFQTAMNNAGRNFEGKKVDVKVMSKFASGFYKLAIHEIGEMGNISLENLKKMVNQKDEVDKKDSRKSVKKLLKKVSKNRKSVKKLLKKVSKNRNRK